MLVRLRRQRSLCIGVGKAKDMGESYDNYETFEILAEVGILFYSFQVPSDFILLLLLFYFIASMVGGGIFMWPNPNTWLSSTTIMPDWDNVREKLFKRAS